MRALRNQGRAPGDTWLQHTHLGYNYRLDEMSAALGLAQMQRIEELIAKRQRVKNEIAFYDKQIKALKLDILGLEMVAKMSQEDLDNPKITGHYQNYDSRRKR